MKKLREFPDVKGNDSLGLHQFSLVLIECKNTMTGLDYLQELDNTASMKTLVDKLPFRLKDRWRINVDYLEEEQGKVVKYSDFVNFVERQARIASNPAFGEIASDKDVKGRPRARHVGTSLATNVETKPSWSSTAGSEKGVNEKQKPAQEKKKPVKPNNAATQKPCTYCNGDTHSMEYCKKLIEQPIGDRLKFLRQQGVCFGCLKKATHHSKECNRKLTCKTCSQRHPTVLHQTRSQQPNARPGDEQQQQQASDQGAKNGAKICGLTGAGDQVTFPTIIPVVIHSKCSGTSVETYAYLDGGSDCTFCTETLFQQLNTRGKETTLQINTINDERVVKSHEIDDLEVSDMERKNFISLGRVYTSKSIPASVKHIVTQEDINAWPYLQSRVELNRLPQEGHIGILIGNNIPQAFEPLEIINSHDHGPYASRTSLGWMVHGVPKPSTSGISVNRIQVNIDQQMVTLFNQDFNERIAEDQPEKSLNDKQFLSDVNNTIKLTDGHYEIGLPLKDHNKKFPNNIQQAEVRAAHLKRRFSKNPEFHEEYKTVVNDMIIKGYAEKVSEEDEIGEPGKVWYIPHHGVYHPRKNKLRVVFDCAVSYLGESLNKELLQGPDLTSSLIGVMLRFRQECIAVTADIEGIFHQVQVPESDRNLLRFLWWPEGVVDRPLETYRMRVHLFGATSSPSCAGYALRRTAEEAEVKYDKGVTSTMLNNFYVDDMLQSVTTEEIAVDLAKDLKRACKEGGFNLTKWTSNSRAVLQSLPEEDESKEMALVDVDIEDLPAERVLGMLWCPEQDKFGYQITVKDRPPTRRGILSVVSSVYDPLGFICPAILPAKQLMQELCKLKIGWDVEISGAHLRMWQQWIADLPKLEHLTVDRCYKPPDFGTVKSTQLHHFSDASLKGYGTVSYLRSENEVGDVHCAIVIAKARVAPVKQVTVPRLELNAATVAVRVNSMIQRELEIPVDKTVFWTDSMTVLRYINNESARFKTFVANRVEVIHDGSHVSQWRYVQTKDNPADDSSRGLSIDQLLKTERWLSGPKFLWSGEEEWPACQEFGQGGLEDDLEVKKVKANVIMVDGAREVMSQKEDVMQVKRDDEMKVEKERVEDEMNGVEMLMKYFSSWYKLKRAIAWILRIKKYLLQKIRSKDTVNRKDPGSQESGIQSLTVSDMKEAERAAIEFAQRRAFPKEIAILKGKTCNPGNRRGQDDVKLKKTSSISKLHPFVKDGLLRVGGRLARAAMPEDEKFPVILPKESCITDLVMRDIHEVTGHGGRNHMLSHLQRKFWVVKANSAARRIIGRCVTCRRQKSRVAEQQMADLPRSRVTPEEAPFTRVGVDILGQ